MSLAPQIWVGNAPPTPDKLEPIQNTAQPVPNKPSGGLWTSPLRDDGTAPWIEWMKREGYSTVTNPRAWKLTVADSPTIYTIDGLSDLQAIAHDPEDADTEQAELLRDHNMSAFHAIDWEGLFAEYDAIHLTQQGLQKTHFTPYGEPKLYGWDCETVLWGGWEFSDVEFMGHVEISERDSL